MCKGLGLDLCEIARMETLLENQHFLERYFGEEEISYIRSKGRNAAQTLAGIFAAKEALAKALGRSAFCMTKQACRFIPCPDARRN